MAFTSGTATNFSTLLDALVTFATANGWTLHNDQRGTTGEVTLKGTGLAGTDAIYVGIKKFTDAGNDIYGWLLQGYTAFTNAGFLNNPGAIAGAIPCLPLWNDSIDYWFFVNARRMIVVAKVSTVYLSAYLGYMLPYASPGQYAYPLVIGGSNVSNGAGTTMPRYSDTTATRMGAPFIPVGDTSNCALCVRTADGTWQRLPNALTSIIPPGQTATFLNTARGVHPYCEKFAEQTTTVYGWAQVRPNQAGDYPMQPLRICRGDTPDLLGIFDGVRFVPGYGLSAQDTITEGGNTWLVFQDTFKTSLDSFFAVLEA